MSDTAAGGDRMEQTRVSVELDDGRTFEAVLQNPDLLRYEDNTDRLHLGTPKTHPIRWLTYCTWAALTRTKELDADMPYEAFKRAALVVQAHKPEPVDPTRPDPEGG
jgi:hypothetical protein